MDANAIIAVLGDAVDSVAAALGRLDDWGLAGTRPGQYRSDIAADLVAVEVLVGAGFSVLSEESGLTEGPLGSLLAVIDPLDGSTNASRGIPWFATSICVLDDDGPLAAIVANQSNGTLYTAVRGEGATRSGLPIVPSECTDLDRAVVGLSGYPARHLGWKQYRALGAVALDMCAVADGTLDGYVDCSRDAHGGWDYLGAVLVCQEAGAAVGERYDRDLIVRSHSDRRDPVAAGTPELLAALLGAAGAAGAAL
ncbi:MAG: inositol monophosphatase family protein [Acidimicrobiales bacterium]